MKKIHSLTLLLFLFSQFTFSQKLAVLTQREQAELIDSWLDVRINSLLP
ncbi:MAG TPA: Xaa-Pro aminopeptidase, partial [Algoriphagus sp.]|nr:Xaa-Pro aminopeptidase [Algoriphagus sp.]